MRIACFDLECTNLNADIGRIICGSVYSKDDDKMYTFKTNHQRVYDDRSVAKSIRDVLEDHHLIIGWHVKGFDLPFLNTRLTLNNMNGLSRKFIIDPMYYARGWHGMKPGNSRLNTVAEMFNLDERKQGVDRVVWAEASAGKKSAINVLAERCESDVRITWQCYLKLLPFIGRIERYGQ